MATLPEVLLSGQRHGRNCAVRGPVLVEVVGNIADHIVKDALRSLYRGETSRRDGA